MVDDDSFTEQDYKEASSFLWDSWFEIPDTTSASRIMRPRCVSWKPNKYLDRNYVLTNVTNRETTLAKQERRWEVRVTLNRQKKWDYSANEGFGFVKEAGQRPASSDAASDESKTIRAIYVSKRL